MSSAPDKSKMAYELSAEEIKLFVSPLVGAGNETPVSRKRTKRWVLANSELVSYDGIGSFIVSGYKSPFAVQAAVRKELSPDLGGAMPVFFGDFEIGNTVFAVTAVPAGVPLEDLTLVPSAVLDLLRLDNRFREGWGNKPLPEGILRSDLDFSALDSSAKRLPELSSRLIVLRDALSKQPIRRLMEYPIGLIHGDPGVDNCFVSECRFAFVDGPTEVGPEIVDAAYFLQSAAACLEGFDPNPTLQALAKYYNKDICEIREELILADAVAHSSAIGLFDKISTELAPDFAELYDHLIAERVSALERIVFTEEHR